MQEEPERIARLNEIGEYMRRRYREIGFDIGASQTPIIPIIIRDDNKTLMAWKMLFEAGVYTNPVLPPAVPPALSLLRTSYMATHTQEQLDEVLTRMEVIGKELGVI